MMKQPTLTALALLCLAALGSAQAQAQAQAPGVKTYIVQLADAPAASYTGNLPGLRATRPPPGRRLDARAGDVRLYANYLRSRQVASLAAVSRRMRALHNYSYAFNGYAVQLTPAQAKVLKNQAGVVSVEPSVLHKPVTYASPDYLGLTAPGGLWSQLDASAAKVKGENIIIGIIDTGIWPENPSFGDKVDAQGKPAAYHQAGVSAYGPPPAGWAGRCDTGPGFTAAMCGGKLIGARFYADEFLSYAPYGFELSPLDYLSPRDGAGHGSHTAATAAGNAHAPATVRGVTVGTMSGMAPRARIAAYKACWEAANPAQTGCYESDMIKAIDDAVSDGVHVINFSISGSTRSVNTPLDMAFLNAATAGVFVSVAAGNAGPGPTVNNVNPWVTTVAAASDDRTAFARLRLANGSTYLGASSYRLTLPAAPLVLSDNIPAAGHTPEEANLCLPGSLSSTAAIGRMVVCDRGTATRLEKSAEVKRVGGVAMVMLNTFDVDLLPDFHSVPTVHLPNSMRDAVRAQAQLGSSAGIMPPEAPILATAPVVAEFSSRGPSAAVDSIFKPDIAAPGVNIVAALSDLSLTQEQHDAVVLGNLTPSALAGQASGTSMATPHVAGLAALIKQLRPNWTPAAIKSALVTTAAGVKLADGRDDHQAWGYGGGMVNPNAAAAVPLVYDINPAEYGSFLCGQGLDPGKLGSCDTLGSIAPWNLNLPALASGDSARDRVITRTVTNVTGAHAVFNATASLPGWRVEVTPSQLSLPPGAKGSFSVHMVNETGHVGIWSLGSLVWRNGIQSVRSPLAAKLGGFEAPALITDKRRGTGRRKVFTVYPGVTFYAVNTARGLVPATLTNAVAMPGRTNCTDLEVATDTDVLRVQLFNSDTAGGAATDLNLQLFQGAGGVGPLVGASNGAASEEAVSVVLPAAGTYSACVVSANVPAGGAAYTMSSWAVGANADGTLRLVGPYAFVSGKPSSMALAWTAAAGQRYLGTVRYSNGIQDMAPLTQVLIDNR